MVFGTFDFLHIGHIHLLKCAKALGDKLVVSVARDVVVRKIKGKRPVQNERERKKIIAALAMVDRVILGDSILGTYTSLGRIQPDIIAVGYDQAALEDDVRAFLKERGQRIKIRRISSYKPGKRTSSRIKQVLSI